MKKILSIGIVLFLISGGIAYSSWYFAGGESPYEDFTTYTEVDPNTRITVTSSRCTASSLTRDEDAYVYKDMGAGHFSGDFEHLIDIRYTGGSGAGGVVAIWAVADQIDDMENTANGIYVYLYHADAADDYIYLVERNDGSYGAADGYIMTVDTTYYLKIKRDEAVGANGTAYCYIYDAAARQPGDLVDTLSVTLTDKEDFQYLYAMSSRDSNHATRICSGWCENLDLQE